MVFLIANIFISNYRFTLSSLFFVLFSSAIFFVNHLLSFKRNFKHDTEKKQHIGRVMFFPYARIVPMHFTIAIGIALSQSREALILFLILKTIADVVMHQIEHA